MSSSVSFKLTKSMLTCIMLSDMLCTDHDGMHARFDDETKKLVVEIESDKYRIVLSQIQHVDDRDVYIEIEGTGGFLVQEWVFSLNEAIEVFTQAGVRK